MGDGIGVGATCQRGRQWSTERCFVPCPIGTQRLSLGTFGTVTLTVVGSSQAVNASAVSCVVAAIVGNLGVGVICPRALYQSIRESRLSHTTGRIPLGIPS